MRTLATRLRNYESYSQEREKLIEAPARDHGLYVGGERHRAPACDELGEVEAMGA